MAQPARPAPLVPALQGDWLELPKGALPGLPAPLFVLREPSRGRALWAFGEALRLEAHDRAEALRHIAAVAGPANLVWSGAAPPELPGPWLGGLAFDLTRPMGPQWAGFALSRWVLPSLLVWTAGDKSYAAAFCRVSTEANSDLHHRLRRVREAAERGPVDPSPAEAVAAHRTPQPEARAAWEARIDACLSRISQGALSKVVLARAVPVALGEGFSLSTALDRLAARFPTCRTFCLRGDGGGAFLGASPETFATISGGELATEALAGSARPSQGMSLLRNPKDLREHGWVVEHLREGLRPLARAVEIAPAPTLKQLANVVHLQTPVRARLAAGVGPAEAIAALHPTPAVGGTPGPAALRFLAEVEGLDRGLYTGLVGLLGEGRAELSVALRSALIRGQSAQLFVGAGVVEGSVAQAEWDETELKASALLQALGAEA